MQCDIVMGSAVERGGPRSEAAGVHHHAKLGVHDLLLGPDEGVQHGIAGILLVTDGWPQHAKGPVSCLSAVARVSKWWHSAAVVSAMAAGVS